MTEEKKCYMIFLNGNYHDRYGYVSLKELKVMMKDLSRVSKNQPVSAFEYNPNKVISHMEYYENDNLYEEDPYETDSVYGKNANE